MGITHAHVNEKCPVSIFQEKLKEGNYECKLVELNLAVFHDVVRQRHMRAVSCAQQLRILVRSSILS